MENTYQHLKALSTSDYQIVNGEPNIIGWEVKNEAGMYLGEIKDLLFDYQSSSVRYLIIDLTGNGMNLDGKNVIIPIGIAHLHTSDDEVVLPNVHQEQFITLPEYTTDKIGPEMEEYVREVIGSPAALRIEEKTAQFDQQQFYAHQHFNNHHFYQRGGDPNRAQQQSTIHQLIENSKEHDYHAADHLTGENTHHNEQHQIKPWLQPGASHNQGAEERKDD